MATVAADARKRVFISSTSKDLQTERRAIITALSKMSGIDVGAMERFGARPDPPLAECLAEVRNSHIYVGIFANRYGFIPKGLEISITEAEYQEARRRNLPCLIFLAPEGAPDDPENAESLSRFRRSLVSDHTCCLYSNSLQLPTEVAIAVHNLVQSGKLPRKEPLTAMEQLRVLLAALYTAEEFRDLCSDLGISHESLAGADQPAKARELIQVARKEGKLENLATFLSRDREGVAWGSIFSRIRREWRDRPWWERAWRVFLSWPLWRRAAAGLSLATLLFAATYTVLPDRLKEGVIWPARQEFVERWTDSFLQYSGDGWKQQAEWTYTGPKPEIKAIPPLGDDIEDVNPADRSVLLHRGTTLLLSGFAPKSLYDCDIELDLSIAQGTRASWMVRSQPQLPDDGYLVELAAEHGQLEIYFSPQRKGSATRRDSAPVSIGRCCEPSDVLSVRMFLRRKEFRFDIQAIQTNHPNDLVLSKPHTVTFRDSAFRYGALALKETDPHSAMLVHRVTITDPGGLESR